MSPHEHYRINSPGVIHELFDNEVVIINLDSGNYYSVNEIGLEIWKRLINGMSLKKIISSVVDLYDTDEINAENTVHQFIKELSENEIIVPSEGAPPTAVDSDPSPSEELAPEIKRPFISPQLKIYTDMQELLLLDPIHEVDETGWPSREKEPVN